MDGQPTNTSVQHDTEEFYNILFDRIENLIKPTPQKYLFQSTFGGQNCSQMVCQECGFVRNRFEDFYNISVTVKERKSIEESIKKNIEGEIISDYECPGCKKKVDITKRTLFSKTPNVLVVQLQRLIFDFDTFQNQKVNSHFEFPENLDLTQYSLNHVMKGEGKLSDKQLGKNDPNAEESDEEVEEYDNMTDEEKKERVEENELYTKNVRANETECYEYKLVGVIIHIGTADAGHYYSLVNTDRFQKENEHEEEWLDTSKDRWMEFNDSRVSDYNYEDFKGDCFGGSAGNDDWFGGMFKTASYGKSAYLLVYEKRFKKPLKIIIPKVETSEGEEDVNPKYKTPKSAVIQVDEKTKEEFYEISMKEAKIFVPNKIYKEIFENNLEFSFEKLIYSKEFYEYVKELMSGTLTFKEKMASLPESEREKIDNAINNITTVGNKIVFEVLVKAYHNYKLPDVAETLSKLYEASDTAVLNTMKYILQDENSNDILYVFKILLNCNDKVSRNATSKLLGILVNRCFEIERDYINETEKVIVTVVEDIISTGEKEVEKEVIRIKSMAIRFYNLAVKTLREDGPSHYSKFEQYLTMMKTIIIGGETQINMVMERGGIISYIDFILGHNSPLHKQGEKRTRMGSAYSSPNFEPLLEAIAHLILRCYTPQFNKDSEDKPSSFNVGASKHYELKEEDIKNFLINPEFLRIAITNSSEELGKALALISYKNLDISQSIGKVILKTINSTDYEKIQN